MAQFLTRLFLHILPAYAISLAVGALTFCVGFGIDPTFSVRGFETATIFQTLQNLFPVVYILGALIVSPIALIAIAFSEFFRWQSLWIHLLAGGALTTISFAVFIILTEGAPWVLDLGAKPPASIFTSLGSIEFADWALVLISASGACLMYWLLAGRSAGGWRNRG